MDDDAAHNISRGAFAALEAELHALETEGRRAIGERIEAAREWGDLKENAEYHDAKDARARPTPNSNSLECSTPTTSAAVAASSSSRSRNCRRRRERLPCWCSS
jgi:transcription elongation GreA/GreB family factor